MLQFEKGKFRGPQNLNHSIDLQAAGTTTEKIASIGRIIGVDNGNPLDHSSYKINQRKAFNGLCLVIVQSTNKPGKIKLVAESDDLKGNVVEINSAEGSISPVID